MARGGERPQGLWKAYGPARPRYFFDQIEALGELSVRWTGATDAPVEIEVDEFEGTGEPDPVVAEEVAALDAVGEDAS